MLRAISTGGSLDPQGPVAEAMADLWWLMLALGTAVFLLFVVLLVLGLRRGDHGTDSGEGRLVRRWIVGGGIVLPVVVILVVFAATVQAMRAMPDGVPSNALVVEVVGYQWYYEVTYPEAGVSLRDELRLPVGRPVALELTSADVIHSFWVPALGGKLDMLPDGVNTLVLEANQPGEHVSRCAEFCGLEHATMELRVVVEPADDFAAWLETQR